MKGTHADLRFAALWAVSGAVILVGAFGIAWWLRHGPLGNLNSDQSMEDPKVGVVLL